MELDTTNQVDGGDTSIEDTAATNTGVGAEATTELEPQYDEAGNLIEPVEEDEEIELDDGLKLKVPKTAAQKLKELQEGNLRQADYTRKTQALAERGKAFDAERSTWQQATQQERDAEAAVRVIDFQLSQLHNVNWAGEKAQAQADGNWEREQLIDREFMRFTQLQAQRGNAVNTAITLRQQREAYEQQTTAKQIEEGRAEVAKIPGWSEQLGRELKDFAIKEVGFAADEIGDEITFNPKVARALMLARKGLEAERKAAAANKHIQAQTAQPAARAGGSTNPIPANKLDDRLSQEEWLRRREKQVRERAR